jgi:ERF superfamily
MTSEQVNELAAALAKAQGAMSSAAMNKVNPHFKSKYADLASVFDAARKPLSDNGLAVTQTIDGPDLVTRLLHTSGQWLESKYPLPVTARPQEMGSALTYARRYSLSAIIGIAADEDDDANAAEGAKPAKPVARKYELSTGPGVTFHPAPKPVAAEPAARANDPTPPTEPQQEPAADHSTPPTPGGGLSLLDMAREAAKQGNQFFYGSFWDMRSKAEQKQIAAIKGELNAIMAAYGDGA